MLHRSAETASYPGEMAKLEISIADETVWQIDRAASRAEETREAFLRRIVEEAVVEDGTLLRRELEELWDSHSIDLGGKTAAELIREGRDSR
jgi:hypothetical protein